MQNSCVNAHLRMDAQESARSIWRICKDAELPEDIVKQYVKLGIREIYSWQDDCLRSTGVMNRQNLVYSAPTSGGKSFVFEIAVLRTVLCHQKKAIVVFPYVSLVIEKERYFKRLFNVLNRNRAPQDRIRVRAMHGEAGTNFKLIKEELIICTIEKANAIVNSFTIRGQAYKLGCVVIDEMHMLGDAFNGYLLEILVSKLHFLEAKSRTLSLSDASLRIRIQLVAMTATVGNIESLCEWFRASLYTTDFRPVPLREHVVAADGVHSVSGNQLRSLQPITIKQGMHTAHLLPANHPQLAEECLVTDPLVILCHEGLASHQQVLIFCPSKLSCEQTSRSLCKALPQLMSSRHGLATHLCLDEENAQAQKDKESTCESQRARRESAGKEVERVYADLHMPLNGLDTLIQNGIAYHHAGMPTEARALIEKRFREGTLSVLAATSTLAAGVNLPAGRVIIKSMRIGRSELNVTQYKQMAGRAGRAGQSTHGEAFLLVPNRLELRLAMRLVNDTIPDVVSHVHPHRDGGRALLKAILEMFSLDLCTSTSEVLDYSAMTLMNKQYHMFSESIGNDATCTNVDDIMKSSSIDAIARHSVNFLLDANALEACQHNAYTMTTSERNNTDSNMEVGSSNGAINSENVDCQRLRLTRFGRGIVHSGINPDEAIVMYKDLLRAQNGLSLADKLHVLYLVSPLEHNLTPNFEELLKWCDSSNDVQRRFETGAVGDLIGINDCYGYLANWSFRPPSADDLQNCVKNLRHLSLRRWREQNQSHSVEKAESSNSARQSQNDAPNSQMTTNMSSSGLRRSRKASYQDQRRNDVKYWDALCRCKRLWGALIIYELVVNGKATSRISQDRSISVLDIDALASSIKANTSRMQKFCIEIGWASMEKVIKCFKETVLSVDQKPYLDLLRAPFMNPHVAAAVHAEGISSLEDFAESDAAHLATKLQLTIGFEMREYEYGGALDDNGTANGSTSSDAEFAQQSPAEVAAEAPLTKETRDERLRNDLHRYMSALCVAAKELLRREKESEAEKVGELLDLIGNQNAEKNNGAITEKNSSTRQQSGDREGISGARAHDGDDGDDDVEILFSDSEDGQCQDPDSDESDHMTFHRANLVSWIPKRVQETRTEKYDEYGSGDDDDDDVAAMDVVVHETEEVQDGFGAQNTHTASRMSLLETVLAGAPGFAGSSSPENMPRKLARVEGEGGTIDRSLRSSREVTRIDHAEYSNDIREDGNSNSTTESISSGIKRTAAAIAGLAIEGGQGSASRTNLCADNPQIHQTSGVTSARLDMTISEHPDLLALMNDLEEHAKGQQHQLGLQVHDDAALNAAAEEAETRLSQQLTQSAQARSTSISQSNSQTNPKDGLQSNSQTASRGASPDCAADSSRQSEKSSVEANMTISEDPQVLALMERLEKGDEVWGLHESLREADCHADTEVTISNHADLHLLMASLENNCERHRGPGERGTEPGNETGTSADNEAASREAAVRSPCAAIESCDDGKHDATGAAPESTYGRHPERRSASADYLDSSVTGIGRSAEGNASASKRTSPYTTPLTSTSILNTSAPYLYLPQIDTSSAMRASTSGLPMSPATVPYAFTSEDVHRATASLSPSESAVNTTSGKGFGARVVSVDHHCRAFLQRLHGARCVAFEFHFRKIPWQALYKRHLWTRMISYFCNTESAENVGGVSSLSDCKSVEAPARTGMKDPHVLAGVSLGFGDEYAYYLPLPAVLPVDPAWDVDAFEPGMSDQDFPGSICSDYAKRASPFLRFPSRVRQLICRLVGFAGVLNKCPYLRQRTSLPVIAEAAGTRAARNPLLRVSKNWMVSARKALLTEWQKGGCVEWKLLREIMTNENVTKVGFDLQSKIATLRERDVIVRGPLEDPKVAAAVLLPTLHSVCAGEKNEKKMNKKGKISATMLATSAGTAVDMSAFELQYPSISSGQEVRRQKEAMDMNAMKRCCFRAISTIRTMAGLAPLLRDQGVYPTFSKIEMPLVMTVAEMEYHGMAIDCDFFATLARDLDDRMKIIERYFHQQVGDGFNYNSVAHVRTLKRSLVKAHADRLVSQYQGKGIGDASAASGELPGFHELMAMGYTDDVIKRSEEIAARKIESHPLITLHAELVMIARSMAPVCGNILSRKFHGRVRAEISTIGTDTGRLIFRNPALQHVSKKSYKYRSCEGRPSLHDEIVGQAAALSSSGHPNQTSRCLEICRNINTQIASGREILLRCRSLQSSGSSDPKPTGQQLRKNMNSSIGRLVSISDATIAQPMATSLGGRGVMPLGNLWRQKGYHYTEEQMHSIQQVLVEFPDGFENANAKTPSKRRNRKAFTYPADMVYRHEVAAVASPEETEALRKALDDGIWTELDDPLATKCSASSSTTSADQSTVTTNGTSENVTINVNLRSGFCASEGCVLLAADYSQIELRIMAHFSNDQSLCSSFHAGVDVFRHIAAKWRNKDMSIICSKERDAVKQLCYACLYGAGPKLVAESAGVSVQEASKWMREFVAAYPGLTHFMNETKRQCGELGYVQTVLGRRRAISNILSPDGSLRSKAERQAVNSVCQGSAADLIKLAMINITHRLAEISAGFPHRPVSDDDPNCDRDVSAVSNDVYARGPFYYRSRRSQPGGGLYQEHDDCRLVLQVHDELVFETKKEHLAMVATVVRECMENAMPLRVPLRVKLEVGDSWATLKEYNA